jgi:hypothetical protein
MSPRRLSNELPPDEPSHLDAEPEEPTDPDDSDLEELPCTDEADERRWEAFIPDDDEFDPEPEHGDFWIEDSVAASPGRFLAPL